MPVLSSAAASSFNLRVAGSISLRLTIFARLREAWMTSQTFSFWTVQKLQQITLSTSLTMIELPVMAGCAHTADCAI